LAKSTHSRIHGERSTTERGGDEKLKRKGFTSTTAVLLALTLLAMSLVRVSAVPLSPYIMVVPEKTLNPALTPGSTYSVTIYTDYADTDIWAWQFGLTFNPAVLNGTSVVNGDLITTAKDPSAIFVPGTFNNTAGKLSVTTAYFDYSAPPPPTTYGPGAFATVSFDVIGYGSSDIMLVGRETKLVGAIGSATYNIIDGFVDYQNIGHGFFSNKLMGDADGNTKVDVYDLHQLGKAYASIAGPPPSSNWNSDCDFNHDFAVNLTDLSGLRSNYGESI
jgi:hypothetical protein